jgi:uncharacterized protein (DUF302 family)
MSKPVRQLIGVHKSDKWIVRRGRRLVMKYRPFTVLLVGLVLSISAAYGRPANRAKSSSAPNTAARPEAIVGKQEGIVTITSNHSVDETVERLKSILQSKGITLFALVDHSGEAAKVGMKMPNTKLLIFGSPKGGTPLMLAAPSIAIDLPLKILVAEDAQGKVWVSYNSPEYLKERHGLPPDLLPNIAVVGALAAKAAE